MTLGLALVAALVFLAWLTDRTAILWPALVVALILCSGLSLSSHSAVEAGASWRSETADWVHLATACIWIGGLVQLAVVVWPLAPTLRREAFLRFSKLAGALVGLMVVAGAYLAYERLPAASDLWQTHYGRILLVKGGIVALALSWGAMHHFVVRPALERGRGTGSRVVSRSLLGESAVAIAILLVVAVLVDANPPAKPAKQPDPGVSRQEVDRSRFPGASLGACMRAEQCRVARAARRKAASGARRGRSPSRPGKREVGVGGFEPPASCSQSRHSNQAELHPESALSVVG